MQRNIEQQATKPQCSISIQMTDVLRLRSVLSFVRIFGRCSSISHQQLAAGKRMAFFIE